MFKHSKNGRSDLGTMSAPGFQLPRTCSYGKWSKSWKLLWEKGSEVLKNLLYFTFKGLLSGLWEVAWPHMAMVAYFHINWPKYSDKIPKASNQSLGSVDSYNRNVLSFILRFLMVFLQVQFESIFFWLFCYVVYALEKALFEETKF